MKHTKIAAIGVAALLLNPAPASALLADWDTDESGILSEEEWAAGFADAGLFTEWDADADGVLAAEEFGVGLFERFDDDGDGVLTVAEWDEGFDAWYGERAIDLDFSNWDADADGVLTETEFVGAFDREGIFTTFARDGGIADVDAGLREDEFVGGLFDWFDQDDDLGVSEEEIGLFDGWFG